MAQTHEFKTEVRQLLHLMIHSLYSNKDIFMRELVANAADAIDKLRFESVSRPELARDWRIVITPDKDAGTLCISDNGVGMTEEEVIANIGTIAQSGTRAFLKSLEEKGTGGADLPELIGQFGVGFYSAFMVADEVTLLTRKAGTDAPAVRWTSNGEGTFELEQAEKDEPGTEITLKLKPEAAFYLETWKVSEVISRYSDFIAYPIVLPVKKVNDDKTESIEERVLNSAKAIWLRKPDEVTEEEHKSFFAHLGHGGGEYLKPIHISAEGISEFKALLYLPREVPFNLFMPDMQKKGLQLYVKRVFISDDCKELLPDYLRFVRGVVDSSDLPLNVSREILQDNPQMLRIQKALVGRILSDLKKMQETEPESYKTFFKEFGKVLKEGIHSDYANAEKLKGLALYETMNSAPGELVSLSSYVAAMPESQKDIYYITAEKREIAAASPALEFYRDHGFDVLLMTDAIDEWVMQSMMQFEKKNFKPIAKGEFEPDATEKEALDKTIADAKEKFAGLLNFLQNSLKPHGVSEVRFTGRFTSSPCGLVVDGNALSPQMERLFRSMKQEIPESKRILELNPAHPLIEALQDMHAADPADPRIAEYTELLFDQAVLAEGGSLADPAAFARRLTTLLMKNVKAGK